MALVAAAAAAGAGSGSAAPARARMSTLLRSSMDVSMIRKSILLEEFADVRVLLEFKGAEEERAFELELWQSRRLVAAMYFSVCAGLGAVACGLATNAFPATSVGWMLGNLGLLAMGRQAEADPAYVAWFVATPALMAVAMLYERVVTCGPLNPDAPSPVELQFFTTCPAVFHQGSVPLWWCVSPLLAMVGAYVSGVKMYVLAPTRMVLSAVAALCIVSAVGPGTGYENVPVGVSYFIVNAWFFKMLYDSECNARMHFINSRQHQKTLLAREQQDSTDNGAQNAHEGGATLVKNALRLTFPENPFHDAATEQRVELARVKANLETVSSVAAHALVPSRGTLPGLCVALAARLRSVKTARFTFEGDPVVVYSIPNLEVLDREEDLLEVMRIAHYASELPEVDGLLRTEGFCWSPCAFIIHELPSRHVTITLREVALELSSNELTLDWGIFKPLVVGLVSTLCLLHANGLMHRQINSGSIILTSSATCSLVPVSFLHAFPEARKKLWGQPNVWIIAPEARGDSRNYNELSEVWSVCMVVWEMLVGPLHGYQEMFTPLAIPPTVPKRVVRVLIDGLSVEPAARPTMEELLEEFRGAELVSRESTVASAALFQQIVKRLSEAPPKTRSRKSSRRSKSSKSGGSTPSSGAPTPPPPPPSPPSPPAATPQQQQQEGASSHNKSPRHHHMMAVAATTTATAANTDNTVTSDAGGGGRVTFFA